MKFIKAYPSEEDLKNDTQRIYVNTDSILEIHQSMKSLNAVRDAIDLNIFSSKKDIDTNIWFIRVKRAVFFTSKQELQSLLEIDSVKI